MTKEDQEYYDKYFELFTTDGWKQLVEELKIRDQSYDIANITDEKTLYQVRGELSIIRMLVNFQSMIETGHEQQQESN